MGDIVELRGPPAHPEADHEFVSDCCRYQEGIATEQAIKAKYRFADEVWDKLGDNEKLLEAIADEKTRRIRTGQQKRERSQQLITKAPAILDTIMSDPSASPRHRVDAIKTLDGFAAPPSEVAAAAADRFQIVINLGADTLKFDRSIAIDPDDTDPNDSVTPDKAINHKTKRSSGSMQLDLFTATTPDKPWDSGSDEPVKKLDAGRSAPIEQAVRQLRRREDPKTFLRDILANGPAPATLVEERGAARGFSKIQIRYARRQMKIISFKGPGKDGGWFWVLPHDNRGIPMRTEQNPAFRGL